MSPNKITNTHDTNLYAMNNNKYLQKGCSEKRIQAVKTKCFISTVSSTFFTMKWWKSFLWEKILRPHVKVKISPVVRTITTTFHPIQHRRKTLRQVDSFWNEEHSQSITYLGIFQTKILSHKM